MTKTIAQICREFLHANPSYNLKALEEEAGIGKEGSRQGKVLWAFKNNGGLSDHHLVRLVACLLKKGLLITPHQAYAVVDAENQTLYIGFIQSDTAIETYLNGVGTTFEYVQTTHKTIWDSFESEGSPNMPKKGFPRTPKKERRWWLTQEWEQTPLPEMRPFTGIISCLPDELTIKTPFGVVVGKATNAHNFTLTIGQEVPLRRVSITENNYEII